MVNEGKGKPEGDAAGVNAETADLLQNIAVPLIEKLGVDPCLLGIVVVVMVCLVFMWFFSRQNNKHNEAMAKQWARATGGKDCGDN